MQFERNISHVLHSNKLPSIYIFFLHQVWLHHRCCPLERLLGRRERLGEVLRGRWRHLKIHLNGGKKEMLQRSRLHRLKATAILRCFYTYRNHNFCIDPLWSMQFQISQTLTRSSFWPNVQEPFVHASLINKATVSQPSMQYHLETSSKNGLIVFEIYLSVSPHIFAPWFITQK